MQVKVEMCSNGFGKYHGRCTITSGRFVGKRVNIVCDGIWTRKESTELRDHLVYFYGVNRNSIKIV